MLATLSPKDQKFIKDSIKKYDDEVYKCMKTDISFKKDKGGRQEIVAFCKRRIVVFRENNNKVNTKQFLSNSSSKIVSFFFASWITDHSHVAIHVDSECACGREH